MKIHNFGVTYRGRHQELYTLCGKSTANLSVVGKTVNAFKATCKTCIKTNLRECERIRNGYYDTYGI